MSIFDYGKWNKEQREGIAKLGDTLAASAIIGAAVGMFGHLERAMHPGEVALLIALAALLIDNGLKLRREY